VNANVAARNQSGDVAVLRLDGKTRRSAISCELAKIAKGAKTAKFLGRLGNAE